MRGGGGGGVCFLPLINRYERVLKSTEMESSPLRNALLAAYFQRLTLIERDQVSIDYFPGNVCVSVFPACNPNLSLFRSLSLSHMYVSVFSSPPPPAPSMFRGPPRGEVARRATGVFPHFAHSGGDAFLRGWGGQRAQHQRHEAQVRW